MATGKYLDTLPDVFGAQLLFPETFVGRGDMSRGGLLLRAARCGDELAYRPVAGATLRGTRPPKLPTLRGDLVGHGEPEETRSETARDAEATPRPFHQTTGTP